MSVDLTISIVNTNNRDLLCECLRSVFENTRRTSLEVYVVDNVCTDGSAGMVRAEFPQAKLIVNERRLRFCANHNQALRRGQGRYLLILNEDTVVPPGAFDTLVEFMDATPGAGIAGATILNPNGTVQVSHKGFPTLFSSLMLATTLSRFLHEGLYPNNPVPENGRPIVVDWMSGACLLIRRETMDEIGLLDEQFLIYAEETDWCYRAKKAGWEVYYLPAVEILHWGGQSTSQQRARRRFRINRSNLLFFRKHCGTLSTFGLRSILVITSLARLLLWIPRYLLRWDEAARLEAVYNWRTVLISTMRDDLFDGELFEMD
jgi:GT2 family glycosyltransferase